MKKTSSIFLLLPFVFLVLISCSNDSKKADYLPELQIEIPEVLKENTEAVLFIESSAEVLNQWSITFEDLVIECEPYSGKTEEELSTMDKLKLGKIMMDFMANMGQFAVKVAEIEQSVTMISDGLNKDEAAALELVMSTFEQRITEIGKKYKDFGKENSEESSEIES